MVKLNQRAPDFKGTAFFNNNFEEISLSQLRGKFVILFFYPADFTFVCPTELEDMADYYFDLKNKGVEVISVSTDSHFVHSAWHGSSPKVGKINFPMLSDPTHEISRAYNVLRDDEGVADRATFIIDPEGVVKGIEVNDEPVGRNAKELVRKIEALIFVRENPGLVCPAKWEKGDATLKPGLDLVGKL